ncbi:hypothetical protein JCM31826_10920 [Thermaurantimonas aggregans]|uniref:Uncharacterized protein n=1 Tax=Thermaurantimonas aggregans TaxID=2173829 RepID=A0A401XKU7_9FLAO|nr:hypothetical protein JCM31826_10920 [Thermaurantimonas aggregans]
MINVTEDVDENETWAPDSIRIFPVVYGDGMLSRAMEDDTAKMRISLLDGESRGGVQFCALLS